MLPFIPELKTQMTNKIINLADFKKKKIKDADRPIEEICDKIHNDIKDLKKLIEEYGVSFATVNEFNQPHIKNFV